MRWFRCLIATMSLPLFLMVWGGCTHTPDTQFYVLMPLPRTETDHPPAVERSRTHRQKAVGGLRTVSSSPSAESTHGPVALRRTRLSLGIGPITLPAYLDRPQIVTRTSHAKLDLSEFEQWAAPLQDDVPRVLADNLSYLIPTNHVTVFPWQRSTLIDYQITVDITHFEGTLGESSALTARWRILGEDGRELLMKTSSFSEQVSGQDHEATVASMSRTLGALSREIAAALEDVLQKS